MVCHLNLCIKKWGSPCSFRRKKTIYFSEQPSFHRKPTSSERATARACTNHAKNDAQKRCAIQLNGLTLRIL